MEIKTIKKGSTVTAKLIGEIDHHTAALLRIKLDEIILRYEGDARRGVPTLVLDLSRVPFMDSAGIGMILGRYKKLWERGGRLSVVGASGHTEQIIKMAGIYQIAEPCAAPVAGAAARTKEGQRHV